MRKKNLPPLARRLHKGQAHFERRHSPRARMANGPVEDDGVVELLQLRASRRAALGKRDVFDAVIALDAKPVLRLADIPSLAGDDEDAEVVGDPRSALATVAEELTFLRAPDAHGVFVRVLVPGSVEQLFS